MDMSKFRSGSGFTLMEIIVVILIMGIIAAVAMRSIDNTLENTKVENTRNEMQQLVYAVAGNPALFANGMRTDFGYVGDVGAMPSDLDALVNDPGLSTWSGPYLSNSFVESADDFKRDAWGNDYTLASASIQSSGGGDGTLTKTIASSVSDLTSNSVVGGVTDGAGNPPGDSASLVSVTLHFPNGVGGFADSASSVSSSGTFSFSNMIPIGNHQISAIYASTGDSATAFVSVLPGGTAYVNLRFPGALWVVSSGGGPTSADLEYVPGSAYCSGGSHNDVAFEIVNNGSASKTITSLTATYSHAPTAYFERIRCAGGSVFFSSSPRAASGDNCTFNSPKQINPSETLEIRLEGFIDMQSGSGSNVDMRNTDITVTFSDGSVVTFNTGS
jgi:prepilin-type N-terminal cleavage/methylation domain-containing protein